MIGEETLNLVLIGYRGTGKTAVAEALSSLLGMTVYGTDAEIVRRAGQSIPEIVENGGWETFREMESAVVAEGAGMAGVILDCGGGAILREQNLASLKSRGVLFLLRAAPGTIVERIAGTDDRPSLTGDKSFTDEVREVLAVREPLYRKAADYAIDTDGRTVHDIADQIARLFRKVTSEIG